MDVGFIGAGLMGEGMARRLLAAGHDVFVTAHRNRAPIERLRDAGARERHGVGEVAGASEVLFLCLPNAEVVTRIVGEAEIALKPGSLIIDASTSLPATSCDIAEHLLKRRIAFVDAPVTGGPDDTQAGLVASMVGGSTADFSRARPLIECYSKSIMHMGPVGMGHTAKLINNFVTLGQVALIVEAMRRSETAGLDKRKMYEVMAGGGARSATLLRMVPKIFENDFTGHAFSLENAAKDADYIARLSRDLAEQSLLVDALDRFFRDQLSQYPGTALVSQLLAAPSSD